MMLEVEITKKLRQFSLELTFQGERGCLGILGPSGCGKSMTLKSIAGIVKPDSGHVAVGDRILYDSDKKINIKPQMRKVGYLFQNYALFPNMTVEQNIGCGLEKKDRLREEKIKKMIDRFQLQGLEKSYPGRLSGGQQQRVALARILAYEPEVLLLDEPFSAMDAYLKEGLRLQLAKVIESYEGVTVLVTHDRDEAYQLCSQILLLQDGKVLEQGWTRTLFDQPKTAQAARLTGCKNLSRFEKISDYRVRAIDWNVELTTSEKVGNDIRYVGIRAHDFKAVPDSAVESLGNDSKGNLIPTGKAEISEMPFEWYVTLENGIWWKTEKSFHSNHSANVVPAYLQVDPEAILLLRGEL